MLPTITPLDNQFTILYKNVLNDHEPLRFYSLQYGKVHRIRDDLEQSDTYYLARDMLHVFYEQLLMENNFSIEKLNQLKDQILHANKKVDLSRTIVSYTIADLIESYNANYKKHHKQFKEYFGPFDQNDDVYYYEDLIDDVMSKFNNTGDQRVLDLIITDAELQAAQAESHFMNANLLQQINSYKMKFTALQKIKYDTKSFMEDYRDWVKDISKQLEIDLKIAENISATQDFLLKVDVSKMLNSPVTLEKLVKTYSPKISNNNVDMYDGLDIFNSAHVNTTIVPYIIYKDYNQQEYYKLYTGAEISSAPSLPTNTIYFPMYKNTNTYDCFYHLDKNQLEVHYLQFKHTLVENELFTTLPTLTFGESMDTHLNGTVNIWKLEIDESKLLHLILNHPLLNKIIFVTDKPKYMIRTGFYLKLKPLHSTHQMSMHITQQFFNQNKTVETTSTSRYLQLTATKTKLTPYIHIQFKNVTDFEPFLLFVKLLLERVKIDRKETTIASHFNDLLYTKEFKKSRDVDESLQLLKNIAPDVFTEGYANFCGKNERPTPIDKDDIDTYIKNRVKGLKKQEAAVFKKYGVLDFEVPSGDIIHLACHSNEHRYPYLKNTKGSKKLQNFDTELIPNLPCCKIKPKKTEKKEKQDSTHITTFYKILKPEATGELKPNIKYLLDYYNMDDNNFTRVGVEEEDALLRAVCLATNTKYTGKIKGNILSNIDINITKQECYDKNDEKIREDFLENPDADLHYRLLEDYFNINIYIFDLDSLLRLPRFKMFHSRPVRANRQAVLLYQLENHYECIVNGGAKLHPPEMSMYCHQLLEMRQHTLTVTQNLHVYADLYTYLNVKSHFQPVSQYIDEQGKARGFNIKTPEGLLTLLTIPTQPENLPEDKTIHALSYDSVKNIMTQNATARIVNNLQTIGLWFRLFDLDYGVAIPITPTEVGDLIVGPAHPLLGNTNQPVTNYLKMKKILSFVLQVIAWLYMLSMRAYQIVDSVDAFFEQFVEVSGSENYIDILNLPRKLPIFEAFEDHFNYVQDYCPALVNNEKITLSNDTVYNAMKTRMILYDLNNNDIPHVIADYYEYVDDYEKQPDTLIFIDKLNLIAYMMRRDQQIYNTAQESDHPYVIELDNGQVFLVQKVASLKMSDAVGLIEEWVKKHRNEGAAFQTDRDYDTISPNIYKINNETKKFELVKVGADSTYNVVDYAYRPEKVGEYGAMLNLL